MFSSSLKGFRTFRICFLFELTGAAELNVQLRFFFATSCLEKIVFFVKWMSASNAAQTS